MNASPVRCVDCGAAAMAGHWGFALMARGEWTTLDRDAEVPLWLCGECSCAKNSKLRVLLVDDEELVLGATARQLDQFEVTTARSAGKALEILAGPTRYD